MLTIIDYYIYVYTKTLFCRYNYYLRKTGEPFHPKIKYCIMAMNHGIKIRSAPVIPCT